MDLLAREQEAEQHVHDLLKATDIPITSLLQAFETYRQACQAVIFEDFEDVAQQKGRALWHTHTEGKKYFHSTLSRLRRRANDQQVQIRQLIKLYLQFIKESQRFYLGFIYQLNTTFGGIPELQAVAHQVKKDGAGESSQVQTPPALRQKVLESCHQTLIYLGDLCRYRASEKLDKEPKFNHAIGYYGLACTLIPTSGMGQHQLAVIALEQRQHLRAIYHLYRAMVVADPHPNAANNLKLEFEKTNSAWDRGELIQNGSPNDPEASIRTLVGWFVRLHSMCFKGEPFRGYDELEREVQGRLGAEIKVHALGSTTDGGAKFNSTTMRIILVNLAAQFNAGENFQNDPSQDNQNAFLQFFRINIKTFTTLLRVYYEDLKTVDLTTTEDDVELATRLTDLGRSVLPALRLYSSWLLSVTHLLTGLATEESLSEPIDQFWRLYAKTIDLVATVFPIWDLEELSEVEYMLDEDVDTMGFKPLLHERTKKIWYSRQNGAVRPRFSDFGVQQASQDNEMLARVKELLADGLFLANDVDDAPIKLRGTRVLHRDAEDVEVPVISPLSQPPKAVTAKQSVDPPAKPLSYAAAAANGPVKNIPLMPNGTSSTSSGFAQHAQLSRMVDDLVDDDESNNPVTPPQQQSSNPAVVTKDDVSYSAHPRNALDFGQVPSISYQSKQAPIGTPAAALSPNLRSPKAGVNGSSIQRLQSVSNLWNDAQPSSFPSGLPTGTLGSPAHFHSRGHSRVNSASSIRSRASQGMGIADSWSSLESTSKAVGPNFMANGLGVAFSRPEQSTVASPLLFGAGDSVWSTRASSGGMNGTPNGQGG